MTTHHPKIPPHVTQFRLQYHEIIHEKTHPYALVHKSQLWKPAKCLSLINSTYVYHHNAHFFVTNLYKLLTISEFMKIWPHNSTKETGWGDCNQPKPTTCEILLPLLTCTIVQLFWKKVIQNELIPHTHHYLIYYLRKLLRIFIFGYPASNIAISSSTSSRASNIWVTPFYLQSATIYAIHIITSETSVGTTKSSMIGHTNLFWIGTEDTGNTMNITWTNPNTSHS